jgi:peptide/nickel transport system permease protein
MYISIHVSSTNNVKESKLFCQGSRESSSSRYKALKRLSKNKLAIAGLLIVVFLVILAVFAPFIAPYNPLKQDYNALFSAPSLEHWLGTDMYGRDMLSRIIHGTKYALLIGVAVVTIQVVIGVPLGLIAGYYGGITESVIMRITDMMLAIPAMVLALAIAGFLGGGLRNVIIAVGAVGWRDYARLVRGEVLSVKKEPYVEAARASGGSNLHIILHHILPNVSASLIVYITLSIPSAILWAAALSFLGLGAQPPTPEWGSMLADGRSFLRRAWWIGTFPGLAIMFTVLGFNFLGDGLNDVLNPKTQRASR